MSPVRWLSCALAASLLLVTSARGGSVLVSPLTDPSVCGDSAVAASLVAVDFFVVSPHCVSLCKRTESECKKLVRRVVGCYRGWLATAAGFSDRSCTEMAPAVVRECKAQVGATIAGLKQEAAMEVDTRSAECETWSTACQAACAAP
jgi:hypothetical protein